LLEGAKVVENFERFAQLPLDECSNLNGYAVIVHSLIYDQYLLNSSKGQNYTPTVDCRSHELGFSNTASD